MSFKSVSPKVDFPALERQILDWWYKSGIVKKYLQKNSNSSKKFSFLDGPITANNPMGVHHAWGRTYKDLWQRFKNMQGFKQRFQNGFDNQGLWVEVEVEKDLGFKSKKDIEKFGIENFVNKCKERTLKFAQIQTEQSKRLGYFMDWDNSYYTMSDENNYTIWTMLKKCNHDDLIYKGKDSVPWCPRCGTAISQHEILTEEYKELTHTSVYFKCFRLNADRPSAFLVWTTTPWTVPADIALAVNPDFTYAEFKVEGETETLVFTKDLREKVLAGKKWEIVKEMKGSDLAKEHYEAPFDNLPVNLKAKNDYPNTFHQVVLDKDLVTAEEGTGIVHIVPGAGSEDYQIGLREQLPVIEVIDESADYLTGYGELEGKNAKDKPELVFKILKEKDGGKYLFKLENYTHRYPVCWRCKTELVWRVVSEWYIKMDPLREPMKKVVEKINWIPKWGGDQELDWLKNMHDWLISKKRYWGLALPIWECKKCGNFDIIGSKDELKEKAVEGWEEFEGHSPHKPWIDKVKIKCLKCGEIVSRIPEVGNPWLDAGIVPFSTLHYLDDKKYWGEWFPADFITECFPGQFKNWFYSLLAMSTIMENTNPFKTLLGHALVRDEKGEEMHKSKGNAIWFDEAAEKIGVDVMRWMYVTQNPEYNLNFGYHLADETRRRFHLMLWNIYNFFVTYANIDKWEVKSQNAKVESNVLDRWIVSRLNQLIKVVTKSLEKYDAYTASLAIENFVSDLSTWYVRRSRDRVGPAAENNVDKTQAYQTLYTVLVTLLKLLAPFIPFMSEEIYTNITQKDSVHLEDWPTADETLIDIQLISNMERIREVCEVGHALRKKEGVKVRQPLSDLFYSFGQKNGVFNPLEFRHLVQDELNVRTVIFGDSPHQPVHTGKWLSNAHATRQGDVFVSLQVELNELLKKEGQMRELVRQIQELRKEKGFALDEKVVIRLPDYPEEFTDDIKKETLAEKIEKGPMDIRSVKPQ